MKKRGNRDEGGYALIAIMGVMMFGLILTTAAAPKLKLESQREKEEEMLWRGQQISTALTRYQRVRGNFPTDLTDLVKGIDIGTKKMRFLRPSALCDPMMPCTPGEPNWRAVRPGDPLVKELLDAYIATRETGQSVLPPPQQNGNNATGNSQAGNNDRPADSGDSQSGSKLNDNLKGPIIGVTSERSDKMFRNYYGLDRYDKALFFPEVMVIVSGFVNPLILGGALASGPGPDPKCPRGGVYIEGKCWGGVDPVKRPDQPPGNKP
jgi:type II secretory pathway pseudopilin PulG